MYVRAKIYIFALFVLEERYENCILFYFAYPYGSFYGMLSFS